VGLCHLQMLWVGPGRLLMTGSEGSALPCALAPMQLHIFPGA
jgi:hypothetical protein